MAEPLNRTSIGSEELLAKPDKGLVEHLAEVTALGAEIAQRLGLPEPLRVKALLACAFHDIGKATTDFQSYIRGQRKKAYPHALASLPFVLLAESLLAQRYGWERHRLEATAAVLTHHSPLGPELYKGFETVAYHPELEQALCEVWAFLEAHGVRELPSVEEFWRTVQPWLQNSPAALLEASFSVDGTNRTLRGILQGLPPQEFAQVKAVLHLADWLASAKTPQPSVVFLQGGGAAVKAHMRKLGAPLHDFQSAEPIKRGTRAGCPLAAGTDRYGQNRSAPALGGRYRAPPVSPAHPGDHQRHVAPTAKDLRRGRRRLGSWAGFIHAPPRAAPRER
jgi:CRISPR-associated endonuclease/helicase Cas3